MPTAAEIARMENRKNAAKSALKFFKEKRAIKSPNNPFAFAPWAGDQRENAWNQLINARQNNMNDYHDSFNEAARLGLGNCDEKGKICYLSLRSNVVIAPNSVVTLCESVNYDHVFVVVTDGPLPGPVNVNTLGDTAMIVDGWTEDWYFPNLNVFHAKFNGLGNTPNPRQAYVRIQIERHQLQAY